MLNENRSSNWGRRFAQVFLCLTILSGVAPQSLPSISSDAQADEPPRRRRDGDNNNGGGNGGNRERERDRNRGGGNGGGNGNGGGHRNDEAERRRAERERREREDRERRDREERDRRDRERERNPQPQPQPNPGRGEREERERRGRDERYRRDHQRDIDARRERVRRDRDSRRDTVRRDRDARRVRRDRWYSDNRCQPVRHDRRVIRDRYRWVDRYDYWWDYCQDPRYYAPVRPVHWYRPMPPVGYWTYRDIEVVADNLEVMSQYIYQIMMAYPVRGEDTWTLQNTLLQFIDAADNYNDAVNDFYDWSDSIYDLFYLDMKLQETQQLLRRYNNSWRVQEEILSMRYYVDELLWQYRRNHL